MNLSDFKVSTDPEEMDFVWIVAALRRQYWGARYTAPQVFKACEHSLCFSIYCKRDNDTLRQVGFARVVTDQAIFSSLQDVVIDEEFRGIGLGKMLLRAVTEHPQVAKTINILGTRYAHDFYSKFGWREALGKILQRDPAYDPQAPSVPGR